MPCLISTIIGHGKDDAKGVFGARFYVAAQYEVSVINAASRVIDLARETRRAFNARDNHGS